MKFLETSVFTKQIVGLLADEQYRALQAALMNRPELGVLVRGSGGLRKVRWSSTGKGKRGGIRVIYYWFSPNEIFLMLFAYPKSVQSDLTVDQIRVLRQIMESEYP